MHDAGNPKPVFYDSQEGWGGEGGGRGAQEGGHMYAYGQFMLMYGRGHHRIAK